MSVTRGVPAIPAALSAAADSDLQEFLAIWQRVLNWDAADGLSPLSGPYTALCATKDGLRMLTPCDVSDPFMVDQQLQRTLVRRHVLTELVPPTDGRFSAGGRVTTLDGGEVTLSKLGEEPVFSYGDAPPAVAKEVPGGGDGTAIYVVSMPFVNCSEVSDAIGRHPQSNPFAPPELELEPELRLEPPQ